MPDEQVQNPSPDSGNDPCEEATVPITDERVKTLDDSGNKAQDNNATLLVAEAEADEHVQTIDSTNDQGDTTGHTPRADAERKSQPSPRQDSDLPDTYHELLRELGRRGWNFAKDFLQARLDSTNAEERQSLLKTMITWTGADPNSEEKDTELILMPDGFYGGTLKREDEMYMALWKAFSRERNFNADREGIQPFLPGKRLFVRNLIRARAKVKSMRSMDAEDVQKTMNKLLLNQQTIMQGGRLVSREQSDIAENVREILAIAKSSNSASSSRTASTGRASSEPPTKDDLAKQQKLLEQIFELLTTPSTSSKNAPNDNQEDKASQQKTLDQILEHFAKMAEKLDQVAEKQDTLAGKQDTLAGKQDTFAGKQDKHSKLIQGVNGNVVESSVEHMAVAKRAETFLKNIIGQICWGNR
ncbi:unnamed protein product [Amoebophrya sp. A120]|nr:unnamed protein product [Amoebophrya sp. A120]|eukprot:GSA120T00025060001.1